MGGLLLIGAGVWLGFQVFGGNAFARLGLDDWIKERAAAISDDVNLPGPGW